MGRELGNLGVIDVMCRIGGGMLMNSLVVGSAAWTPRRTVVYAEGASLTDACLWRRRLSPGFGVPWRAKPRYVASFRAALGGSRMGSGPHLAQGVHGDQRVDLRGGHRGVTQQLLHHPHVGPALQQVRGEAVPQHVR